MLNVLSKIFGTKNDRDLKRIRKIVDEINKFEPTISSLSDEELKGKTVEFRARLDKGETLDDILTEAFRYNTSRSLDLLNSASRFNHAKESYENDGSR